MSRWVATVRSKLRRLLTGKSHSRPLWSAVHIAVMALFAVIVTFAVGWALGLRFPQSVGQVSGFPVGLRIGLAVMVGAAVALTVSHFRRPPSGEDRSPTERFLAATELLGSGKANIRTAGAHAMAQLADDWNSGRQTCIDVLCHYIRTPYEPPEEKPEDPEALQRNKTRTLERGVRHTVLSIVGERLRKRPVPGKTWHGHDFDFSGATIDGGNLIDAKITGGTVDFSNARFIGGEIRLDDAMVSGGCINFTNATFAGGTVDFQCAQVAGGTIDFSGAELVGGWVRFLYTDFTGGTVDFTNMAFTSGSVDFCSAELAGGTINFHRATFGEGFLDFDETRFADGTATFNQARFTEEVCFGTAEFTGATMDFRHVADWSRPPRFPDFPDEPPAGLLLPITNDSPPKQENPEALQP